MSSSTTRGPRKSLGRGGLEPYLYLLPALIVTMVWVYFPLIQTAFLSFYKWNLLPTKPMQWVGWLNFTRVFTLPEIQLALGNTLLYVVALLPFSVVFPTLFAVMVTGVHGKSRNAYRSMIFAPVLVAPVVASILWSWLLHPSQGLLGFGINWFRDPNWAIWAIILITGWKFLGFSFLIITAGLTNISREYYEAAYVDGASRVQTVVFITLPLLTPTLMFMLFMTVLLGAQWVFPMISVLTHGGPQNSTTNIFYMLWELGFQSFNVGLSSAAAVVFFLFYATIAYFLSRFSEKVAFHDS